MGAVTPSGEMYCYGCQLWKPLSDFGVCRRNKSGRQSWCRECRRTHRLAHRDIDAARIKAWREANREVLLERKRAYYRANKQRVLTQQRKYYQRVRERKIAYQRTYYHENRERVREAANARARANRAMYNEWNRRRHARKMTATIIPILPTSLVARWDFYGGACWLCGGPADTWDHVKPLAKGGAHCLSNLRPACKSCNCRKRDKWPIATVAV